MFIAHAGEVHSSNLEANLHMLQEWYIALPLFVLTMIAIATITYFLSNHSKTVTYIVTIGALLVIGVVTYTMSPVISITALTTGMALTLTSVLFGLKQK